MKKYIKTILALATAALLGSSAQAAEVTRTISVGESFTATASKGSASDGGRWWMFTAGSSATDSQATEKTDAALKIVGISFVDEAGNPTPGSRSDMENMSNEHVINTSFTFTGRSGGTVTFRLFGTTPPTPDSTEYPNPIPKSPGITSGSWSNSNLDYYTITVIDPEQPDVSEDVKLTTEDDAVVKTAPTSQATGDWLMKLIPADTTVVSAQFDATTRQVTIAPLAIGSATVRILKGTTGVIDYKVTVAKPSVLDAITSSGTVTITEDNGEILATVSAGQNNATASVTLKAGYKPAKIEYLVVGGGGGSGGTVSYTSSGKTRYYPSNGAGGGGVKTDDNVELKVGTIVSMTAGKYGDRGSSGNGGSAGTASSIQIGNATAITGAGGVKGAKGSSTTTSDGPGNGRTSGTDKSGASSSITGQSVTYGVGGAKGSTSNAGSTDRNAGAGGGGCKGAKGESGTAGNAGVVIVRIKGIERIEAPKVAEGKEIVGTLTYGQPLSTITSLPAGTMVDKAGNTVAGTFAWKAGSTVPSVADSETTLYKATFTPSNAEYYKATEIEVMVTVNRKTLTATATSFSVERGRPVTAEDYVVTYSGWVNGESAATAAGFEPATATSEYSPTTTYPDNTQLDIVVSGGEADNYAFSHVNGKLTVLKPSKSDVQLTDVDKSSGVNGKKIDDAEGRPVVMLGGKTYTFDADANNSEIALMNAGKYAVDESYQLEGGEISKFLLGEFAGSSFAEAFLPDGAWFTGGSFAISADGTTVTFDGGTLSYNDDDFTVPFAGTIELAGDLVISVGDELTVKFPADVTFTGSGKIIKTGAGTLDFDGEVTDVSAEGYEGEVDGEVHQPTVSYTFTPAATVEPARTAVVKYRQAGESAWTTEAPSFSEVVDTTVDYQILVAGILKASGTYAVKITQKEPETEPVSIVMGESQKVTCEGVFNDEEWTVTITGADGLVTVDPMVFTGKVFQPTITAGNAKGKATVTIASDNVKYVYTVTVVASYDEGKVNLAYAGEGMADEVTMFYWYRSSDTKYKPRHMQATPNPGSSYANTDRSAEAVAACNAILDVALNATNAYACVDTRMVAKTSEGETKVGVWRSSDPLSHDDKYDPEGVKTKLGGTPQDSGTYAVVLKPKRVVYVGKSIKAYCTTSFDAASGSRESIYLSAPWTAESADAAIATITASGDAATSFEPEFTGVGVGRTYATVGNLQISTGMSADGSWPSDVTAPSPAPSVVTNGASYKLWVEVRDTPVAAGAIPAQGLYKGNALSAIALPADLVTMKDKAGTTITGTWAWEDGSIEPETSGSFNAVFTPDASFEFHDEVTVEVPVTVYEPVALPTAVDGLTYDGTEQTGVAAGDGYTLDGNTAKNAGSHTATATLEAGCCWENVDGTLDFEDKKIAWSIVKAALTATADDKTTTYGVDAPEFTVSYTGWVKGEEDPTTAPVLESAYVAGSNVGTYDITFATDPVFANYAVTTEKGALTVVAAELTSATATPASAIYTGGKQEPVVTAKAGELDATFGNIVWDGNLTDVGTHTATVTGSGNFTGTATATFEITKASIDMSGVTFEPMTVTYDGTPYDVEIEGDLPDGVSVSYDGNGQTDARDTPYTVTAMFSLTEEKAKNYNIPEAMTTTLKIDPAALTSASAAPQAYTGSPLTPVVTAKAGELDATFDVGAWDGDLVNVGTYTATVTGKDNFTGTATVTFEITASSKKPWADGDDPEGAGYAIPGDANDWTSLTNATAYSAFDYRGAYDGEAHTIKTNDLVAAYEAVCSAAPTITYSCDTNANDWAETAIELIDVGATSVWYRISVSNYEDVIRVAKIVIDPAQVTVTADSAEKTEGQDDPTFTAKVAGTVEGDEGKIAYTVTREEGETVGTYDIIPSGDEIQGNYRVTYVNGTFTIKEKPTITITIEAGEYVDDVQTNGISVVGKLELPADATEVTLTLEADLDILTVPVFKVVTNGVDGVVTSVTTKVATYAIKDGDTLEFFAEEAEYTDPDVTEKQVKDAIIDAIDPPDPDVPGDAERYQKAVDKVDAVVDTNDEPAPDKVSAKDMATWISDNEIKSVDMAQSDYLVASVKLDTEKPITEENTTIEFVEVEEVSSEAFTFDLSMIVGSQPVDFEEGMEKVVASCIQTTGDLGTGFDGETVSASRVTINSDGTVTIEPDSTKSAEFFKIVIPRDPPK